MPALLITNDEEEGNQETTISWSSTDQEDQVMGTPMEPEKTLKDSTHTPEVLEDQDEEQSEEEDEDMEEEEVEMTPKGPFKRVWQGKMVLKAID